MFKADILSQHISKINKQNFDLKLEVFHRRQRSEVLESKVEKLEGLDAENEELRAVNDDLVLQVKKRDADIDMREAAIEEAVGMICDLEARIDDLQQILDPRPKKENMITSSSYRVKLEPPSTPPQAKQETIMNGYSATHIAKADALPSIPSRSPLRQPTFLKEGKRSTAALRSLYSSGNPSFASLKRPSSIFSDEEFDEEMEQQMLNSPRLSILSESGFSSIYGHTREQTATPLQPTSPNIPSAKASNGPAQRAAQREARICDWVEESNQQERPKTPSRQALHAAASCHFSSINEVLEKVPNLPTSQATRSPSSPKSTSSSAKQRSENAYVEQRSPTKSLRKSARAHERLPSRGSSVFGTNRLPPTPDTMSTATIGGTSSTQSIITEKSLADGRVVPPNGYTALLQDGRAHSYKQLGFGRKLASSDHAGFETSDEELESTRAERSDLGSRGNDVGYAESPLFVGGSMKATRFFGSNTPARPALTTHATDVMFNNEGLSPKPPSRGLSYPSPTGTNRRISSQLSPSSKRSSGVPSERTVTSPRPSSPSQVRSSSPLQTKSNDRDAQAELDSKISRNSSSLRFRLPRLSSTSNSTQSQSVTSRIFRRTNSQSSNNLETGEDVTARIRPLQRPRIPRPSSHYGQHPLSYSSSPDLPSSSLQSILPVGMLTNLSKY